MNHPLPKGTPVRTLTGESDEDDDGEVTRVEPGAVGTVLSAVNRNGEFWVYHLSFPAGHGETVWVWPDEGMLDDPSMYEVLEGGL